MHPKLLDYYEKELGFLREMGKEFADHYPNIAQRLDIGRSQCADPYVERLLEGFAFLTARIQLKLDAEFPDFTQYLLNIVYPHYLSPVPSMTIVQFRPDLTGGLTESGFQLPRGTRFFSETTAQVSTRCEFRTARNVDLWPVEISSANYLSTAEAGDYSPGNQQVYAGLQLRLTAAEGVDWSQLPLDQLVFYLNGSRDVAERVYELLVAHTVAILARPITKGGAKEGSWQRSLPVSNLKPLGFSEQEALLPYTDSSFTGYRLLQEYYAFPENFLFMGMKGLQAVSKELSAGQHLEIIFLFREKKEKLRGVLSADNFLLHCAPAVNLFPRGADRIRVEPHEREHHLIVDRTRAQDYEVHSITGVTGFDKNFQTCEHFQPFYDGRSAERGKDAYYTWRRISHLPPKGSSRTTKDHSEVYLSLVNSRGGDYANNIGQLGVSVMCTNRDASMFARSDDTGGRHVGVSFKLDVQAPVTAIKNIAGPTKPRNTYPEGERAWRLINHLSLNYLSLLDNDDRAGAAALRELLSLYADGSVAGQRKQIEGVLSVNSQPIVRRLPSTGPITFGRGVGIDLHCEKGVGAFLLASVLEQFFAKYISINSFVQLRLHISGRGEVMKWPVRTGTTPIL